MRKDSTPRDMLLDRRVVERNIRKGIVTREEYEAFLKALPDATDNSELIAAKLGEEEEEILEDDVDDEEEADEAEG